MLSQQFSSVHVCRTATVFFVAPYYFLKEVIYYLVYKLSENSKNTTWNIFNKTSSAADTFFWSTNCSSSAYMYGKRALENGNVFTLSSCIERVPDKQQWWAVGGNSVLGSCRLSPAGEGMHTAGSPLSRQREEGERIWLSNTCKETIVLKSIVRNCI